VTLIQTMQRRPAVTTPDATLRSAAKEMASQRTALLPVISKGKLIGTLSAMDVTARSVGGGLDPDRRTVRAVMRPDPPTCRPEDTVDQVYGQMRRLRQSVLPVISKGRLIGTLSAMDVTARSVGGGLDPDRRTVRAVMRPDPPTCRPEDTVDQVYGQMRRLRQSVLPVIEANGELVGLVDLFDIEAAGDDGKVAGPEPDMVKRVRGEAH
jgi:CBS domain-containing protein